MNADPRATPMRASVKPAATASGGLDADVSRSETRSETRSLIAASKVNGTHVYNPAGGPLGSIYDVMINKRKGVAEYAILAFGGFLGMGKDYHPLPWHVLKYDERMGGYIVDLDPDRLKGGPAFTTGNVPDWSTGEYGRQVDDYYGSASSFYPI